MTEHIHELEDKMAGKEAKRPLRDRLAEAEWLATLGASSYAWSDGDEAQRAMWAEHADKLLAALPSVGLKIIRDQSSGEER